MRLCFILVLGERAPPSQGTWCPLGCWVHILPNCDGVHPCDCGLSFRETTCTAVTSWAAAGNMAENSTGMAGNSTCHFGRKVTRVTWGGIMENTPLSIIHSGSQKMIHVESITRECWIRSFFSGDGLCLLHHRQNWKTSCSSQSNAVASFNLFWICYAKSNYLACPYKICHHNAKPVARVFLGGW